MVLGVDRTTYTKYESGKSEPPIEFLEKISDFFGVTVDYLIGHESSEKNQSESISLSEQEK